MVSRAKLHEQLDRLEIVLKQDLVPHLKTAASGKNDYIFCVSDFNLGIVDKNKNDALTERLIHIARQVITLRGKLDEPDEDSIAVKICQYCRKWSAEHKRGNADVKMIAKKFLQEIEKS